MLSELAILFQLVKPTPAITLSKKPPVTPAATRTAPAGSTSLRDLAAGRKVNKDVAWPTPSTKAAGTPGPLKESSATPLPTAQVLPPSETSKTLDHAARNLMRLAKVTRRKPTAANNEDYKEAKEAFEAARKACAEDSGCLNPLREQRLSDKLTMADEQAFREAVTQYLESQGTYSQGNVDAMMKAWRQE